MDTLLNNQLSTSRHHVRHSLFLLVFRIFIILFTINAVFTALTLLAVLALYTGLADVYGYILVFGGLWAVHAAQFIVQIVLIFMTVLPWATNEYYITEHQLFHYQGVLHVDERVYELHHIKSVKLYQTLFGRIFGYGTITVILGARGYHETLKITECPDPKKYERLFRNFVQA